ncbi:helix-turn-helix domain-containing protein [Streptomyces rubrogriseus]|uniref:helix-turn-helix domain-containing protein n=1 Tax=Streptomyces rubrogriseus TaxID=194673 RepID=UPI003803DEBE
MPTKSEETLSSPRYSPAHIRATWDGTGSVEDASRALGFSRAKGYDLIRSGQFPCRVLRIGRKTRVVTASLLRVLESGDPEYSDACTGCRTTNIPSTTRLRQPSSGLCHPPVTSTDEPQTDEP